MSAIDVPLVISEELFTSVAKYFIRFIRDATFEGLAKLIRGGSEITAELSDPVLVYTPGGCVVTGGNCWYGGGLLDLTGSLPDEKYVIKSVSFTARTQVGEISLALDNLNNDVAGGSVYRIDVFLTLHMPERGVMRVLLPQAIG